MCYIWWMEMKNVVKDEGVLIFFLLTPLVYPLVYSWIYCNEVVREVPVAIVDKSHTGLSREFIHRFDASPQVRAAYYCNNLQEARQLVGRQVVRGVVHIPSDFDLKVNRGEQTHVEVYCDMGLMFRYKQILVGVTNVQQEFNSRLLHQRLSVVPVNISPGTIRNEQVVSRSRKVFGGPAVKLLCAVIRTGNVTLNALCFRFVAFAGKAAPRLFTKLKHKK